MVTLSQRIKETREGRKRLSEEGWRHVRAITGRKEQEGEIEKKMLHREKWRWRQRRRARTEGRRGGSTLMD